jgi:hypothetical protein
MIKGKIFEKCRKYFEDYLFGFDQDHMQMSLLTGHIDLNNVNIKPDKVNEIFAQANMPIALKAGLISKLSIDVIYSFFNFLAQYMEAIFGRLKGHCRGHAFHHWAKHLSYF